jgi:hypothetical protein
MEKVKNVKKRNICYMKQIIMYLEWIVLELQKNNALRIER